MKIMATFILLLLFAINLPAHHALQAVDGYWKNDRFQVVIEIRLTDYGLKAIRTDQDRWYHYNWAYDKVYTDPEGNRYVLHDSYSLMWESNDGRRLHFRKLEGGEDNDRSWNQDRSGTSSFGGDWADFQSNAQMEIIPLSNGFKARIRSGAWRPYFRLSRNYFEDRLGNSFTFNKDGRFTYRDRYSRRIYLFEQISTSY